MKFNFKYGNGCFMKDMSAVTDHVFWIMFQIVQEGSRKSQERSDLCCIQKAYSIEIFSASTWCQRTIQGC